MLFNSPEFLLYFLPAVVLLVLLANHLSSMAGRVVLALASLYFYSFGDFKHLALLLASTGVNFAIGSKIQGLDETPARRRWLAVGVVSNLLTLSIFKYLNFFSGVAQDALGLSHFQTHIALPLGISFYTFTQIAYLVDSAVGKVSEKSLVDYSLFVWYFPHQIAGPILHHKEMLSQFRSKAFGVTARNVLVGLCILGLGLFKKLVFADWFERLATPIFTGAATGGSPGFFEGWVGASAYALQIYFDFSAYCDMAVGISYMFGIKLPANFDSPYQSLSIVEFWRRWHLTLSRFLRDYLYIPLGGNRHGEARRHVNLLTTMVLGGFWHGASWNFLIWGALHGAYLIVNHFWSSRRWGRGIKVPSALAWLLTLWAVINAWVFFRAETLTGAANVLAGMYGFHEVIWPSFLQSLLPSSLNFSTLWAGNFTRSFHIATLLAGFLWCAFMPNVNRIFAAEQPVLESPSITARSGWAMSLPGLLLIAALFGIALSRLGENSAFIYFNF